LAVFCLGFDNAKLIIDSYLKWFFDYFLGVLTK
jgi:hypothetical protein